MPDSIVPALKRHGRSTKYWSTFEHTGNEYVTPTGELQVETAGNAYRAGQGTDVLVQTSSYPEALKAIEEKHSPSNGTRTRSGHSGGTTHTR